MNGSDLLGIVVVLVVVCYAAWRLDQWEDERELRWRREETLRREREALDRVEDEFPSVALYDQEAEGAGVGS